MNPQPHRTILECPTCGLEFQVHNSRAPDKDDWDLEYCSDPCRDEATTIYTENMELEP